MLTSTGPKISTCAMVAAGETSVNSVRRIEVAFGRHAQGRLPHLGTFLHALLHEAADPLELHRRDDRAHVDGFIERRADAQFLHPRPQLLRQAVGDTFLHEQPRAGAAHLALVEPDRVHHAFDDAVEIGIVEDDERTLAAQLERELLPAAAVALRMMRPTSVDPVNAIFCTSGCSTSAFPGRHRRSPH